MKYPNETHYILDFDPVVDLIEAGFAHLTIYQRAEVNLKEYVLHLLEWLNEKMDFHEVCGAAELAVTYLKVCGIDEDWARMFSNRVLDGIMMQVVHVFPAMNYEMLNTSRFIFDGGNILNVYIKEKETT